MDGPLSQRTASLYVGDLPVDMSNPEEALGRVFGSVGPVASIRVCRDMNTQRSLGYAYVNFQHPADAEKALETLNYTDIIPGRPIRIMPSMRDPTMRRTGANNVYVKISDKSWTAKDLRDVFSSCGKVLSAKVTCDSDGKSLGYGFVLFESADAAKAALNMGVDSLGDGVAAVAPFIRKMERLAEEAKTFVNVYTKNIKKGEAEENVRKEFENFGEVTSMFLSGHPQHETMFSIVSFATHDAAVAAINSLNGSADSPIAIPDGKLFVCRALKKKDRQQAEASGQALYQSQGRNLYVKHLDDSVTREKLEELFSPFGKITSCALMRDASGVSREFGFVCFETKEDAAAALREMNSKTVYSKPLYVSYAEQKDMRRRILHEKMQRVLRQQQQQQHRPPVPMTMFNQPWSRNYPVNPTFRPPFMQPPNARRPPPPMFMPQTMPPPPPLMMNQGTNRPHYTPPHSSLPPPPPPPPPPMQQPVRHLWQKANGEELQPDQIAKLSPEEKRNILGERLFGKVVEIRPNQAAKITGMLLEMETAEILEILDVPSLLMAKVEEAVVVLRQHSNGV
ncbi:putative poly(A)-binding protein [Trypanosoma grayi]|uniref:putative poly(A)-binding protein n=1 Tax=Trypanosoma grayi TaxID=71804 RepID=UPI0004F4AA30|nr:putative poly(A)-binding protein [Trypanosoma grayi]KEG08392.1 putative poly(A)-binding protein [Trypanosoma grayi]